MSAKEAIAHIVAALPETLSFEEIVEALSMIYIDRSMLEESDTHANDANAAA
ncbi:MAG: hypothetical protein LBH85_07770 [Treponema sp.]|jgi:hypothetical protein|nr:hypothetical protein [Treponema sp.]